MSDITDVKNTEKWIGTGVETNLFMVSIFGFIGYESLILSEDPDDLWVIVNWDASGFAGQGFPERKLSIADSFP